MENSKDDPIFSTQRSAPVLHTPMSFRARRRIHFAPASTDSISSAPQEPSTNSPVAIQPPDSALQEQNAARALADLGSTPDAQQLPPPTISTSDANSEQQQKLGTDDETKTSPEENSNERHSLEPVLHWNMAGNNIAALYKYRPPSITYPAGSRVESTNKRFVKCMDMYLFQNFIVRSVMVGKIPHPFLGYRRLNDYWSKLGKQGWTFDKTKTFETLQLIQANGHHAFHQELQDLLWFGGVASYGNIMRETYAIIFNWVKPEDFADLDGLCEEDDGITFRTVIIESLRIVRVRHVQEICDRLYAKLDATTLTMRPGGMAAFFAKLRKIKCALKEEGEIVSNTYMLRRTKIAVSGKHSKLDEVIAALRRKAGTSGIPTTFKQMQDCLVDTFEFEVPVSAKTEKEKVTAGLADSDNKRKREGEEDANKKKSRWKKKVYPKGSCPRCPNATNHLGKHCWKLRRQIMGLPNGWQWCTWPKHKNSAHYEHTCDRHAPNYPPVPKIIPDAAKATLEETPEQLTEKLLQSIQDNLKGPSRDPVNAKAGIVIKRPGSQTQDFHPARNAPNTVAPNGPQVQNVLQAIQSMTPQQRKALSANLAHVAL